MLAGNFNTAKFHTQKDALKKSTAANCFGKLTATVGMVPIKPKNFGTELFTK